MSIVTLSIKDIPYVIQPDTAFHPVNTEAAIQRIKDDFYRKSVKSMDRYPVTMDILLNAVLQSRKARSVWAIVFEYRGTPFYTVRNLAHTNTTLVYRRILVVKLDAFLITYPMRTWTEVNSSLMSEDSNVN